MVRRLLIVHVEPIGLFVVNRTDNRIVTELAGVAS